MEVNNMAVLIPNIELPQTCFECPLCDYLEDYDTYYCFFHDDPLPDTIDGSFKLDDCPLIEVDD